MGVSNEKKGGLMFQVPSTIQQRYGMYDRTVS